jgi:hypothetical protein
MMTETKVTKTPIRMAPEISRPDGAVAIVDAKEAMIGAVFFRDDGDNIVRAVNAHDDLVAALKETLRALEVADPTGPMGSNSSLSKHMAQCALAKAEGR